MLNLLIAAQRAQGNRKQLQPTPYKIASYQKANHTYTVKAFESNNETASYIVYSKNSTNNLPLTTTRVEQGTPCIQPEDLSQPDTYYYPLELDRNREDCRLADGIGITDDPRFEETAGVSVTEYEVQKASGVLDMLTKLPMYTEYVGEDYIVKNLKESVVYKLWTRPTITW